MAIKYNLEKLSEVMWSFYTVSGIRFILFDSEFNKILAYPKDECDFCTLMRKYSLTSRKCAISDRKALRSCREKDGPIVYKCHAGLVEAALALKENDTIIGYLMFGQFTDNKDCKSFAAELRRYCSDCGIADDDVNNCVEKISYMNSSQIIAAAKVMEACTSYIILKELITPENDKIFVDAKEYIENNLSGELDIYGICAFLGISRTKLYEIFKKEIGIGVSEYIRKRRMHKAKKLLKTTEMPIWKIAQTVGFADYTYFGRVYKKNYGKSPREYRK